MPIRGTVDLPEGKNADQVEKEASGTTPGWFRAAVSDVYEKDGNLKLEFTLRDTRKHTETLWNPDSSDKPERLRQRRAAFAIRLGLVPREAKGTAYEFDWLDAIGKEVIMHLVEGKPNDKGQKFIQLDWMALFAGDDPRGLEHLPKDGADPSGKPEKNGPAASSSKQSKQSASRQPAFSMDDL